MTDNFDITGTADMEQNDSVKIADDVVKCIAALAAIDIDGVAGMAGNAKNEIMSALGGKALDKGIKLSMEDDVVRLAVSINVKYGYSIPDVSRKVQEKVRSSVENMTGFKVDEIRVNIVGIDTTSDKP
ncbi:MAG: Asp23/Gls24 family envelope stress response protein [Eubacteriales bacterium]|nr:Asp23/Gls24 family envelope stress response protein [Eubacteriales bacterium]